MVGGVAAGLAQHFGIDVTLVRVAFVVAAILGGGLGIPVYLACLLLLPDEGTGHSIADSVIGSVQGGR